MFKTTFLDTYIILSYKIHGLKVTLVYRVIIGIIRAYTALVTFINSQLDSSTLSARPSRGFHDRVKWQSRHLGGDLKILSSFGVLTIKYSAVFF